MHGLIHRDKAVVPRLGGATVRIASRKEVVHLPRWSGAFAGERKDHRFYELVEDTLKDGFSYGYFVVSNGADVCAIQPYFILDQDEVGRCPSFPKIARVYFMGI